MIVRVAIPRELVDGVLRYTYHEAGNLSSATGTVTVPGQVVEMVETALAQGRVLALTLHDSELLDIQVASAETSRLLRTQGDRLDQQYVANMITAERGV